MISAAEYSYINLVKKVLNYGYVKYPTKGETKAIFGSEITLIPGEVPLLLGRKMYPRGLAGELKSFIQNASTLKEFEQNGCNFWGAWSNEDGSLDVDYARLLHNFNEINQLETLFNNIITSPDSRKHIISLWNPATNALQPPCVVHYQWFVHDGTLDMIWSQRSADIMLGLASDMFSAWLFNQLVAQHTGLKPGIVHMQLGDVHMYKEHYELAHQYLFQTTLVKAAPPKIEILGGQSIYDFKGIKISNYKPQMKIDFELKT